MKLILNQLRIEEVILSLLRMLKTQEELLVTEKSRRRERERETGQRLGTESIDQEERRAGEGRSRVIELSGG